jgi:ech hydrogenase subunit A
MFWVIFLIVFPFLIGLILSGVRHEFARGLIVKFASAVICVGSVLLLTLHFPRESVYFAAESRLVDNSMLFVELALAAYIVYMGLRAKRLWTVILISLQTIFIFSFEIIIKGKVRAENNLFIDKLSIIMALVIGIIGSLICLYSVGYMRDFHADFRKEIKDKRRSFSFLLFAFLSAMFGIVFSNNLLWLYFFWEITTICSFALIRYKRSVEANKNAFLALELNLLGGLAFCLGIIFLYFSSGIIELDKVLALGQAGALLPIVLICFAGLVKSAQLPFSPWLTGAMVAPTPVSALLHSSTMVKAGVYIILRLAIVLQGTLSGFMIAFIGGTTFLIASFIAITVSDAKKVLAYSTIANLGLIVLCAGIGTYEAIWAAILLIIFHAIAKCLLFLCVGVIEHKIHSRNIEDMSGLIVTMPKMSIMMQIGMAGMFLAPFGMLISKWAVLKALVDYNPLLAIFVVFGSSATLFFWVKWMGKLITVTNPSESLENKIAWNQWFPLYVLSFLTISICGFFPLVSKVLIEPYVREIYGNIVIMSRGNLVIMAIMLAMVMLFPLSFINYGKKVKVVDPYLGGANAFNPTQFYGALGRVRDMEMKNYYLERYFSEVRLLKFGSILCLILIIIMTVILI